MSSEMVLLCQEKILSEAKRRWHNQAGSGVGSRVEMIVLEIEIIFRGLYVNCRKLI